MKRNIILIVDGVITYHDSIQEAEEHSQDPKYDSAKQAHIYGYCKSARKGGFRWETKKPVERKPTKKRSSKRWTDSEQELLIKAKKDGKSNAEIAKLLYRTKKAIDLQWRKLGGVK